MFVDSSLFAYRQALAILATKIAALWYSYPTHVHNSINWDVERLVPTALSLKKSALGNEMISAICV
jgi:hypothetical protein